MRGTWGGGGRPSPPKGASMMNLSDLFSPDQPLLEMVIRGSAIYWFLLIVFRFVLRRDVGSMSMADLLFIVLVADASSNAMQGEYRSVTNGVTLLATLIGWNYLLDLLGYRYEWVARVLAPPPEPLVRHGRLVARTLRRERISVDELMAKLREHGIDDLGLVRVALLEADGKISVIRNR
jgi:uncharacterized membrane protein YcaP (DUF421 family)